jgi:hypothetical protein
MMKRHFFFFVCFALVGAYVSGLDVDETELSLTRNTAVEFINYEGPHAKIESLEQIMGVGVFLGESVDAEYSTAGFAGKYRVIHAVDDSRNAGLDADIFVVLQNAAVDHIRNLRHMVAGFLTSAYGYELDDALVLAEFVTVYNAVYRGKMSFFGQKYKQIVTNNLTPESVGLSTLYVDWPGNTEMVIPLTKDAEEGGLGALDTDVLTDEKVIDELRTQDDMGLESRKDITEIKEREVEETQVEIEAEKEAISVERERIQEERTLVESERERIDSQQEATDSESEQAQLAQEVALEQEQESLDAEDQALDQREEVLAESEAEQAERIEVIQQEREEIASDERELIERDLEEESVAVATATGERAASRIVLFLEVRDVSGESLGRLVHVDSGSGMIAQASTINSIRNLRIESLGQSFVVVAGTTLGQGAVRLMTLDQETLGTKAEGSDDIYEGSFLVVDDLDVYALTGAAGSWKLGKFDSSLALRQVSELSVFEDTSITLADDTILVVGADGEIHMLSKTDLATSGTVQ